MPATVQITRDQIQALADLEADVIVVEYGRTSEALEAWVLEDSTREYHRTVVVDNDGEVLSDTIMEDTA